jgi:hypothetical protein
VYRRQHAQGPIHDSWTDLSLQLSERTNEVMILESRREWAQASSRQSRTFYTSKFHVNPKRSSRASSPSEDAPETVLLPENDLFVDILDSSNKPNWNTAGLVTLSLHFKTHPPAPLSSRKPNSAPTTTPAPPSLISSKTKPAAPTHPNPPVFVCVLAHSAKHPLTSRRLTTKAKGAPTT